VGNKINIATAQRVTAKRWKNKRVTWERIAERLGEVIRTAETVRAYHLMSKADQSHIKDSGGYFGGYLVDGRRRAQNVAYRQLVTLDLDYATEHFWSLFTITFPYAAVLHSTHSHTPENPRYRLVFPLTRKVSSDEYLAVTRWIAGELGIEAFDPTTFQPYRMMYWPSVPNDADYVYEVQDGEWCDPDEVLAEYDDWRDMSAWPSIESFLEAPRSEVTKAQDPLEKPGLIGAFCRTYDIHEAIETFLPDVYEQAAPDRYTYLAGSSFGGAIAYDDKFLYSYHGTDPARERANNAFDLVRIHKFGDLDTASQSGGMNSPSYKAMVDWVAKDEGVRRTRGAEREAEAANYFTVEDIEITPKELLNGSATRELSLLPAPEADPDWNQDLELAKSGGCTPTAKNIQIILRKDPVLDKVFCFNMFDQRPYVMRPVPWFAVTKPEPMRDAHLAGLRIYMENIYDITSSSKITDGLLVTLEVNKFHPVQMYLDNVKWDGTPRIDTLAIDYLGAKDSPYVRTATRKMMLGAVARIYEPGVKFDFMYTLTGAQGIGKSTFFAKLAGPWYSSSLDDIQGKDAYEQLQGAWIVEMGELTGIKNKEVERIKQFLSQQVDSFRPAYGRVKEDFPRQCIIVGTSNERNFLVDTTGNRRFLPVHCGEQEPIGSVWDWDQAFIDQVWAEAVEAYRDNEPLYLDNDMQRQAQQVQARHMSIDERTGMVEVYLAKKLPHNWRDLGMYERRMYLDGAPEDPEADFYDDLHFERERVCVAEVWAECFERELRELSKYEARKINDILRTLEGWEYVDEQARFQIYGKQRYYQRVKDD